MAARRQMGIAPDARPRRTAVVPGWFTRRIHYRALLGLHMRARSLQRISRRAPALENLERRLVRVACRCRRSLWRPVYRNVDRTASLGLHRRRLFHRDPHARTPLAYDLPPALPRLRDRSRTQRTPRTEFFGISL